MIKKMRQSVTIVILLAIMFQMINIPVTFAEDTIDGWKTHFSYATGTVEIDKDTYFSGNGSLRIQNDTGYGANQYVIVSASVNVKEGKAYYIGGKFKADNVPQAYMMIDWGTRYTLTQFGNTFDWKKLIVGYIAEKTGTVEFQIIVDNKNTSLWLDEMQFTEVDTGRNMIQNSTFDTVDVEPEIEEPTSLVGVGLEETYNAIRSSASFIAEDMVRVRGGFKYMTLYPSQGISIDGNNLDWESYPVLSMPTLSSQYKIYIKDDRKLDAKANCKFSYDNDNFYLMLEVEDDKHYYSSGGLDYYWQGDSLQLAISSLEEGFGSEIGLAYNPESGKGEIYSKDYSNDQVGRMKLECSSENGKLIYEYSFPWDLKFPAGKPDGLLFDVIINDNDGDGRRYCVELAPGIAEGKTNVKFPYLELLEKRDWYAWIEANTRKAVEGTEIEFEYFLVNNGEEREFTIKNIDTDEIENVTVPANTGIRREYKKKYDNYGMYDAGVIFSQGEEMIDSTVSIEITRLPASLEYSESVLEKVIGWRDEINELIIKCNMQGIEVDYELVDFHIIEEFCTWIADDISNQYFDLVYYYEETLREIYEKTKDNLEKFISGEKTPLTSPRYVQSKIRIDGQSVYAMADNDGVLEERPIFFMGYNQYGHAAPYFEEYSEWGLNKTIIEMGPNHTRYIPSEFNGWGIERSGSPEMDIVRNSSNTKDGETSAQFTSAQSQTPNVFIKLLQNVEVTPGSTYILKGWAKANNAANVWVGINSYTERHTLAGTYDWKEFECLYKAPEDTSNIFIQIINEDKIGEFYLDGLTFCEEGTDENLLENGSFDFNDEIPDEDFVISEDALERYRKTFEICEENNIAVTLAIAPHVFPVDIIEKYDMGYTGTSFIKYNINRPEAKAVVEKHIRAVLQMAKEFTCLHDVLTSNEPDFQTYLLKDYYRLDWQNWLKERYGNDIQLLNSAYKTSYTSFEELDIITSNPAAMYDYNEFNDFIFAGWHRWMTDIVHDEIPGIPVSTKIMAYVSDNYSQQHLISNGTGYEHYIDFCALNGNDSWNYYEDTHSPLRKLMWYDFQTSLKQAPVYNSENHVIPDRSTAFDMEVSDYVSQDVYQGAIHGAAMDVIWLWHRVFDRGFDSWGGMLYRPDTLSKVHRANLDLNRNAYQITALQKEYRDVGIVYTDSSIVNDSTAMHAVYQAYAGSVFNGKRVQFITDTQSYKMKNCEFVIVPNQKYVNSQLVSALYEFIQNGGKVLIMGKDSLKQSDMDLPNNQEQLSYIFDNSKVIEYIGVGDKMTTPTSDELYSIIKDIISEAGIDYVTIKDSQTGDVVWNIEYNIGVCDGKLIVNLSNIGEDRTVSVYVDGKKVEKAIDIRADEEIGSEILAKKYVPVTLEIDIENQFLDTIGHWAENNIKKLSDKGIINGVTDSRYAPNRNITRAEFLALLMRTAGWNSEKYTGSISDVSGDEWYASVVQAALDNGIISENADFRPNDLITREEMCGLLVRSYEKKYSLINEEVAKFTDYDRINDKVMVDKAVSAGLMIGLDDGRFAPENKATRAEAATVIERFNK